MVFCNKIRLTTLAVLFVIFQFVECTQLVPVYLFGNLKSSDHVPALQRTNEDSFKDTLSEYLNSKPYIVVFAENTLSPEDFAQRNQDGELVFSHLSKLQKTTPALYRPYVQNPIGVIKELGEKVTELSIGSLLNSPHIPEKDILIVDLNDARDDEDRFHMLRRHDSDIVAIYKDILDQHENVLAIYTAYRTSWVAPEGVASHKRSRSLLADGDGTEDTTTPKLYITDNVLLYLSDVGRYTSDKSNISLENFVATSTIDEQNVTLTLTEAKRNVKFAFYFDEGSYWNLESVVFHDDTEDIPLKVTQTFAPLAFSYHCGSLVLSGTKGSLTLPGFQIQPFLDKMNTTTGNRFGDAYDCVGFTSVPIWSGLFVTFIMLLILTFGLTMLMDIKTMDRFDDPKGKTITINASE